MKKVAIVGVEGSGKTVMLAGLGELYSHPDAQGFFLAPKNFETANYVADKIERMRRGVWPAATAGDALQGLDWTLRRKAGEGRRPEDVCEVSFLDFAGEVYRVAFGVSDNPDLTDEAESLKRYIREADDVIVLINLSDVIAHGLAEPRVREAMWITNGILSYAVERTGGRKAPRAAIVLSQADSYRETINACGGVRGVLAKYLPHVANNYDWLGLLAASAVDRTEIDDEGRPVPAKDFRTTGLQPIMDWILRGAQKTRKKAPDEPIGSSDDESSGSGPSDGERETPASPPTRVAKVNVVSFVLALGAVGYGAFASFECDFWLLGIWLVLVFFFTVGVRGDREWRQGAGWWFLYALLQLVSVGCGLEERWLAFTITHLLAFGALHAPDTNKREKN